MFIVYVWLYWNSLFCSQEYQKNLLIQRNSRRNLPDSFSDLWDPNTDSSLDLRMTLPAASQLHKWRYFLWASLENDSKNFFHFSDVHDPVHPQPDGRPLGADPGHEQGQADPQGSQLHQQGLSDVHWIRLMGNWRGQLELENKNRFLYDKLSQ